MNIRTHAGRLLLLLALTTPLSSCDPDERCSLRLWAESRQDSHHRTHRGMIQNDDGQWTHELTSASRHSPAWLRAGSAIGACRWSF